MAAEIQNLFIGIDWGTHSSKWWYAAKTAAGKWSEPQDLPNVIDSTIYRTGENLVISRERGRTHRDVEDTRLKRLLLKDPQGASYWDAVREGIGISLGDAATLTIACMLGNLFEYLSERGLQLTSRTQTELRFSLPNWIGDDTEHKAARKRMFQTTAVTAGLLENLGWNRLPVIGRRTQISNWSQLISDTRNTPEVSELLQASPPSFVTMVESEYSIAGIRWRLAAESSAAGYLPLEFILKDVSRKAATEKHWVKLLIVDVGAGSTDTGYLISSRRIDGGGLLMNYLPPARTLDYAGEQLTEMLRDFYWREHNRDLSIEEAETIKLTAPERWINQDFAQTWRDKIAKSVADYMFRVPDEARLSEPSIPGLKIVLTGGSGLVAGLDRTIRGTVADALARRGVPGNVANRTEVVQVRTRAIPDRIDAARRAVSLGAAQSEFAQLVCRSGMTKTQRLVFAK